MCTRVSYSSHVKVPCVYVIFTSHARLQNVTCTSTKRHMHVYKTSCHVVHNNVTLKRWRYIRLVSKY